MKCISCTAEIPANWSYALNNNLCPSCGGPIMDEDAKLLLDELRDAMTKMPNDPEGLSGWLLSNYRLIKIGTAEPTDFYKKNSGKKSNSLKINEDNPVQKFLKRSGVDKQINKQKHLIDLAKRIGEMDDDEQYGDTVHDLEDHDDGPTDTDEDNYDDEESYRPITKASSVIAKNASSLIDPNAIPLDRDSMKEVLNAVSAMGSGDTDGAAALNLQRMQRLRRQQELETMGSVGKIKRSD